MRRVLAFTLVALSFVVDATAQATFQWSGQLTSGQTIEIKGINGDVRATPSSSGQVEVTATKSARRSNPADIRIDVVPHGGGVTICAVYPDVPGKEPNRCDPSGTSRSSTRDNDTVVHFEVRVPAGVAFVGRTVNGSVNVTAGRADWPGEAEFKTVNGGITLTLPGAFDAELRAETLNGSITTDFPMTVTGQVSPRRLRGTIGNGGHQLVLSTVNGSIKLLRAR